MKTCESHNFMAASFRFAERANSSSVSLIRRMNSLAGPETIKLGLGELTYPLPNRVVEAGKNYLASGQVPYTPNQGLPELREAIAKYHQERTSRKTTRDEVIVTAGVQGALYLSLSTFLNSGDQVLIPSISFSPYRTIAQKLGASFVEYGLDKTDFQPDLQDVESKVTKATKLILVNTPNNPTGRVLNEASAEGLAAILEKNTHAALLSDEIYSTIYFEKEPVSMANFSENMFVTDGISKRIGCGTGLRIGYVVAPKEVVERMTPLQQDILTCAPTVSQVMALPVYRGECKEDEANIRGRLKRNRDILAGILSGVEGLPSFSSEGAFYSFVNIANFKKPGEDSEAVARKLLQEENVLTIPGKAFGNEGDDYLRISFATDQDKLEAGVNKIRRAFERWNRQK